MVDLVKIRKKAKKSREEAAEAAAPVSEGEAARAHTETQLPVDDQPKTSNAPSAPASAGEAAGTHAETQPAVDDRQPATDNARSAKLERFKSEAGKRREDSNEEEIAAATTDQVELLTFTIAGEHYAVGIEHIVEIVTPRGATRVPNADETIVGIMSLRGTIVTVIDVRRKLRHPAAARGVDARVIVVERRGETLGFEVDRVLRVVKVDDSAIEPHPVVHASELSEAIRGVFRQAGALTILLDLDKLLA